MQLLPIKPILWELADYQKGGESFLAVAFHQEGKESKFWSGALPSGPVGFAAMMVIGQLAEEKGYRPFRLRLSSERISNEEVTRINGIGFPATKEKEPTKGLKEYIVKKMGSSSNNNNNNASKNEKVVVDTCISAVARNIEFTANFFERCKEYYQTEAWLHLPSSHVIEVLVSQEGNVTSRILQVIGHGGFATGLSLWKTYDQFATTLGPKGSEGILQYKPATCLFGELDTMAPGDKKLLREGKISVATDLPSPYPYLLSEINIFELQILYFCFENLAKFIFSMEKTDAYHFKPLEMQPNAHMHEGCNCCNTFATFKYPPNCRILPTSARPIGGLPGYVPPCIAETVGEGVKYYRKKLEKTSKNSDDYLPLRYGLANCLWKLEEVEKTKEAIAIAKEILKEDPEDMMAVRYFLLDLLFELDDFAGIFELLHLFPDDFSAEWYWGSALVQFVTSPNKARPALRNAIKQNPHVVDFLTGRKKLESNKPVFYSIKFANNKVEGDPNEASKYLMNSRRFWLKHKGAIDWVRREAPSIKEELKAETGVAELKLPKKKICVCGSLENLKMCQRCKAVYYCGVSCQTKDWPTHKKSCRASS